MKMAFKKKTKKQSQNKEVRNMIPQDQALICTASEKSFRLKELSNLTTSFLLRLYCHKRALHFQWHSTDSPLSVRPAAQGYWIFVPSQTESSFCECCWREKELKREWTLQDKKDSSTGACDICFYFVLWPIGGRPTFHQFNNMAPKPSH